MSDLLSQSPRSMIFRELDPLTGHLIVWKVCGPWKKSVSELVNEFTVSQSVQTEGIRKPLHRGLYQNKEAFAYAYFDGITLKKYQSDHSLSVEDILAIALQVTTILKQLHQQGVFHLRLNSNHILYQPETGAVQLIDLSLASRQGDAKGIDFQEWDEELAYVAPEQTGRLNQAVDNRADLYSFGVVLYELLTGQLPFFDEDIAKIVHYHLVKIPVSPHHLDERIPLALSTIVEKLLAKKVDDRYQTAHGLWQDLYQCHRALREDQPITLAELGKYDQSDRLRLSTKVYGRSEAFTQLQDSFEQVITGTNCLLTLSGDSGTGKSTIIQHLSHIFQPDKGILLTITCEPSESSVPYSPFKSGLNELAATILSGSSSKPTDWGSILKTAVADQESVLVRLIPEYKWILETESSPISSLNTAEDLAALPGLFQNILRGMSIRQQPIILVVEDVQWADLIVWQRINAIINDPAITHLLLLVTYQTPDEKQVVNHHLQELKTKIQLCASIHLHDLGHQAIFSLINDSFQTDRVDELSHLLHKKTHGNPFFLRQFLTDLCSEKALWFESAQLQWVWDKPKVEAVPPTGNVVRYITDKLGQLPSDYSYLLMYAACLGNTFNESTLVQLLDHSEPWVRSTLSELITENVLQKSVDPGLYLFMHERVRQVIYESISDTEKSRIHYQIALLLPPIEVAKENPGILYDLATHFTIGSLQIPLQERFFIVEINLRAGLAARQASNFLLAYSYFVKGIQHITEADWVHHYETTLHLHYQATEMGMVTGTHQEADRWLQESIHRAITIDDRIKAHEIKLNHLSENHQFTETIDHLLKVLEEIGQRVRRHPSKLVILWELAQVKWQLRSRKIEDTPEMPLMTDDRANAFLKLITNSSTSIFGYAPDILPSVIFRQVKLSLKYGLSFYSPFGYVAYGLIQVFFGNTRQGYDYGKMALKLTDQLKAEVIRAKVMVTFYGFISFWHDGLRQSIEPLRQAYFIGRQNGDLLYAAFALSFHSTVRLLAGDNLSELLLTMSEDNQIIQDLNQNLVYTISEAQRHLVMSLLQETDDPVLLHGEDFDEEAFKKKLDAIGDQATKFDLYYYKLLLACLFNHYDKAFEVSELASQYEDDTTSRQTIYPSFLLFSTLACLKRVQSQQPSAKDRKLTKKIARNLNLMRSFAKDVPENYKHKHALLQALLSEQKGPHHVALDYYQTAINQAKISNFIHEEAIAREHFSYFLLKIGQADYGVWMLQQAFRCYQKWGAVAKCLQLEKKYPQVVSDIATADKELTIANFQDRYDLTAIIHANQILSSENSLEGLLRRMLDIVIQNASATNVVILLKGTNQQLIPRAMGTNQIVEFLTDVDNRTLLPESVINYVSHTKTAFVSANLSQEKNFLFDSYVQATQPLSVCCLPITTQQLFLGVLYLENNLAESAFDTNRVNFFTTISAQLAISLDNVFLYEEMEQKVQQRTTDLNQSLIDLKATQNQLIHTEKMASLGELTAGIAHEIQNPLNFVNNFSEISSELSEELKDDIQAGRTEDVLVIAETLIQNLKKIAYHGQRASSIVRGMLDHSRNSTGDRQPANLNALIDEYLRLAYHGQRAKNKDFSCELITHFDPTIGKINIISQEMGRVLLNLINNAFYTLRERQKQQVSSYHPAVTVTTLKNQTTVEIQVEDNGMGMSESTRQKIFQPFFTTKPTGEGTGLGLSLSYDIITKGHGGMLSVESQPGKGTVFIIQLPIIKTAVVETKKQ